MSKTTIYYGLHNNQVKLYVVINGKRKNKALSFFGDNYKVKKPIKFWDNSNKRFNPLIVTANSVEAAKVPTLLEFAKTYAQLWKALIPQHYSL